MWLSHRKSGIGIDYIKSKEKSCLEKKGKVLRRKSRTKIEKGKRFSSRGQHSTSLEFSKNHITIAIKENFDHVMGPWFLQRLLGFWSTAMILRIFDRIWAFFFWSSSGPNGSWAVSLCNVCTNGKRWNMFSSVSFLLVLTGFPLQLYIIGSEFTLPYHAEKSQTRNSCKVLFFRHVSITRCHRGGIHIQSQK